MAELKRLPVQAISYAAVSALAAPLQQALGHLNPPLLVILVAVTAMALTGSPHRWTTLLLLTHVLAIAATPPAEGMAGLAGLAALAASLGALHLLSPWLAWRRFRLTTDRYTLMKATRPFVAMTALALAASILVLCTSP